MCVSESAVKLMETVCPCAVSVDGKEVGVVDSPALSRAFFEVYLGEKSKTPDVREKWAVALTEWLR
jgi:hypothetical protein